MIAACECGRPKQAGRQSCDACRIPRPRSPHLDTIAAATREGLSAAEIARALEVSERHVVRIRSQLRSEGRIA